MDLLTPGVGLIFWQVVILALSLGTVLFAAYTIFHIVVRNNEHSKATWILIVLLFPIIGSIIYWFNHNRNVRKREFNPFAKS